jgi:hypothetical protein
MKRALMRSALFLVGLVALLYLGDYVRWSTGFPGGRAQFRTIRIQPYAAVPQKNGHTEFLLDDPMDEQCATSLFPHGGAPPCWYLQRHTEQRNNL